MSWQWRGEKRRDSSALRRCSAFSGKNGINAESVIGGVINADTSHWPITLLCGRKLDNSVCLGFFRRQHNVTWSRGNHGDLVLIAVNRNGMHERLACFMSPTDVVTWRSRNQQNVNVYRPSRTRRDDQSAWPLALELPIATFTS